MDLKELKDQINSLSEKLDAVNTNVAVLTRLSQRRVTIYELECLLTKVADFGCCDLTQEETIYFRNMVNRLSIWCSYLDEGKPKMYKKLKYTNGGCDYEVVDGTGLIDGYDKFIDNHVKLLSAEDGKRAQ